MSLNASLARARQQIDRLEPELARVYEKPLATAARIAASRFRSMTKALTAATAPWEPPDTSGLVDGEQVAADAQKKAGPIHERALRLVGSAALRAEFPVDNPFAQQLLQGASDRAAAIIGGFGDELATAIRDAHNQGLSVTNAAALVQTRGIDASKVTAQLLARTTLNGIANGGSLLAAQLVDQASREAGEPGVGGKTWVTAGDERVRETHADADGQTVPVDQPFDVGGEQLMYPGDPNGSNEEIINCRCTLIYGSDAVAAAGVVPTDGLHSPVTMDESPAVTDETHALAPDVLHDFHLTAAAGEPTRWIATLLVEGSPTEDGRMVATDATVWRALPLPLGLMTETNHSDGGDAPVVGRIDEIWRAGTTIQARGIFNDMADDEATRAEAQNAIQLVRDEMVNGISVDPAGCDIEFVIVEAETDTDATDEAEEAGYDAYEDPAEEVYEDVDYLAVFTSLTIGGATICPIQAMAQAKIQVVAAAETPARLVTAFKATFGEAAPEPAVADATETLRDTALAAVAALAAAARPEIDIEIPDSRRQLEELADTVDAFGQRLAGLESAVAASGDAAIVTEKERADESLRLRNEVFDRFADLEGKLVASLTASAAGTEALEQIQASLAQFDEVRAELGRLRELLERKPRSVTFERDRSGKLAGLREE